MPQTTDRNRRIVLARRPQGAPTPAEFRLETEPVPQPAPGQALLRTVHLSLDPYMRGRMNGGPSYAPGVELGSVMVGGTVSRVQASRNPALPVGTWVLGGSGWQDYALSDGTGLTVLDDQTPPSLSLGVLGMPGFTAYQGLLAIGRPQPGETVVVSAATGAVGAVVGQIARLKGCRVVGIAGGPEKCAYAVRDLGFDACLDHRSAELPALLAAACPRGVDVYFENVGGAVLRAVLPLLNVHARIPLCGNVAHYNEQALPEGGDWAPVLMGTFLTKRVTVQGFIIFDDYGSEFGAFRRQMAAWWAEGAVRAREDRIEGLERAPEGLIGLLEGRNFGKLVVDVGPDLLPGA